MVDGASLENWRRASVRGFESLTLRQQNGPRLGPDLAEGEGFEAMLRQAQASCPPRHFPKRLRMPALNVSRSSGLMLSQRWMMC